MAKKLTEKTDVPFTLAFRYPLQKDYTFRDMSQKNLREFQRFLDKVSGMSVQEVNHSFARKPDANDNYKNSQVLHYAVGEKFRIHVVLEAGVYVVIRMDPNHKFHG